MVFRKMRWWGEPSEGMRRTRMWRPMVCYVGVGMVEWWCSSGVMVEYGILNEEESKARVEWCDRVDVVRAERVRLQLILVPYDVARPVNGSQWIMYPTNSNPMRPNQP